MTKISGQFSLLRRVEKRKNRIHVNSRWVLGLYNIHRTTNQQHSTCANPLCIVCRNVHYFSCIVLHLHNNRTRRSLYMCLSSRIKSLCELRIIAKTESRLTTYSHTICIENWPGTWGQKLSLIQSILYGKAISTGGSNVG